MTLYPFYYALSLLDTFYKLSPDEDEFEEIALIAWGLIGNKRTKLYRYRVKLDRCTKELELPCNCDILEAVTSDYEEWNYSTNDTPNGDLSSAETEAYIESRKVNNHPLYASGKFIKYERVGNTLYFNEPHDIINILYKGEILDDNGLPQVTEKEAMAIATFCAYTLKYRKGLESNNAGIIKVAQTLLAEWLKKVDLARVDTYLSLNEWDEILDAKTSWNRKSHGKSLKLYR